MRLEQASAIAAGLAILFIPAAVALTIGIKLYGHWHPPEPSYGYTSDSYYADND